MDRLMVSMSQYSAMLDHHPNFRKISLNCSLFGKEDIQLNLKQYKSNFTTYETPPGLYSSKDISEVVFVMGDHVGTLKHIHIS